MDSISAADSTLLYNTLRFFRELDLVCRVLLLVGVVGGLSKSVFMGVASVANDFLLPL